MATIIRRAPTNKRRRLLLVQEVPNSTGPIEVHEIFCNCEKCFEKRVSKGDISGSFLNDERFPSDPYVGRKIRRTIIEEIEIIGVVYENREGKFYKRFAERINEIENEEYLV